MFLLLSASKMVMGLLRGCFKELLRLFHPTPCLHCLVCEDGGAALGESGGMGAVAGKNGVYLRREGTQQSKKKYLL